MTCPDCGQRAARCWSCNAPMVRTETGRWWCGHCETHRSDGADGVTSRERAGEDGSDRGRLARELNRAMRRTEVRR